MTTPTQPEALAEVIDRVSRATAVSRHAGQYYLCAAKTSDVQQIIDELVRSHPEIPVPEITFQPKSASCFKR
jgi:hypothetical protein